MGDAQDAPTHGNLARSGGVGGGSDEGFFPHSCSRLDSWRKEAVSKQGAVATVKSTLPRRVIENRASGSVPLLSIESTQRWHSVNVS
jgi:hypothetical protein